VIVGMINLMPHLRSRNAAVLCYPLGRKHGKLAVKRREFITFLGGAAAWPLAARAQQGDRMWRIGVIVPAAANDARIGHFSIGFRKSGWSIGRNVHLDIR